MIKKSWQSCKTWYLSNTKKERAALVFTALAVVSYCFNPIQLHILGVATAIGFLAVVLANALVNSKGKGFVTMMPVFLLMGSFAYLRTFPFNPGHLHFWLFILCFYSTLIAVMLMVSTTWFK